MQWTAWWTAEGRRRPSAVGSARRTAGGTEATVYRAVGSADSWGDGGGRSIGGLVCGRPLAAQSQGRTPVGTTASVRRAVGLADGRLEKIVVRRADGQRTARRPGGQTSTGRNGHLQHREYKTFPSAGRSGFYPGVKLMKS